MRTCVTPAGIWLNSLQNTDHSQILTSQFVGLLHQPCNLSGNQLSIIHNPNGIILFHIHSHDWIFKRRIFG